MDNGSDKVESCIIVVEDCELTPVASLFLEAMPCSVCISASIDEKFINLPQSLISQNFQGIYFFNKNVCLQAILKFH